MTPPPHTPRADTPDGAPRSAVDVSGLEAILGDDANTRVLRFPHTTEPDEHGKTRDWHCDVIVSDGVPARGFSTYATVGVRQFSTNVSSARGEPIRTEFVMAARTTQREAADVIDACALAVANGAFHLAPGTILPNAVRYVAPEMSCEHVLLVPPFLWPELEVYAPLGKWEVLTRLQVVPITAGEMRLAAEKGAEVLMQRLEQRGADVSNLNRGSVV